MTQMRVGVVGLGIMGSSYSRHVIEAGFATCGYDVAAGARTRFAAFGGEVAASARDVAERSDVTIVSLASLDALEAAVFGADGVVAGAQAGAIVIETGTFALDAKERVRDAVAARGASTLDVPTSGTGGQAVQRDLTLFASGERAAFERAKPVMAAYARDVRYVGSYGTGSKLKYIANLLVTIHNLAAAEAVVLAEAAGIDPDAMLDALDGSAASSRMLQVRGPMMTARRYEPATMKTSVHCKDIGVIADFARGHNAPTPLFSQSALFYTAACAQGHGEHDTAALAEVLRGLAGLTAADG